MAPPSKLRLDAFLPYRLSVASNRVSDAVASTYRSLFGLRIPEWRLIAVLAESEGLTQHALGKATRMDKVSVSRASATLTERGLIVRAPNTNDQRSHVLRLTADGRALYAEVAPKALEIEARIFTAFSASERAALTSMLARLEDAVSELETNASR